MGAADIARECLAQYQLSNEYLAAARERLKAIGRPGQLLPALREVRKRRERRRTVQESDGWTTTVFLETARYVGTLPFDSCMYGDVWLDLGKGKKHPTP